MAVLLDQTVRVLGLERGIRGALRRWQPIQWPDGLLDAAALLDQGPGDERRALREEMQDVHACSVDEPVVEPRPVLGQLPACVRHLCPTSAREPLGPEPDGLHIVHVQLAEAVQRPAHSVGDGRVLAPVARAHPPHKSNALQICNVLSFL
ncbi:hypothetical protein GCM10010211_61900 [Streptomyces albospinus]|uniref:Uncharacterized protein n=1 Tax=Streptomyces albospinus TaxID=285515 RepID=A0ABQ2VJK1_9ACTN|nr:hypothetical protein [Streptomyces albospinus]GGU87278.1 hypothetical protein GCM10010211_61900 [Streptomyces albospinus]